MYFFEKSILLPPWLYTSVLHLARFHTGIVFDHYGYFTSGSSMFSSAVDFIILHEERNISINLSLSVPVVVNDFFDFWLKETIHQRRFLLDKGFIVIVLQAASPFFNNSSAS